MVTCCFLCTTTSSSCLNASNSQGADHHAPPKVTYEHQQPAASAQQVPSPLQFLPQDWAMDELLKFSDYESSDKLPVRPSSPPPPHRVPPPSIRKEEKKDCLTFAAHITAFLPLFFSDGFLSCFIGATVVFFSLLLRTCPCNKKRKIYTCSVHCRAYTHH